MDFVNSDINFMYLIYVIIGSLVFYTVLTIYAWPFRMVKDGRKVGCFYCCSSEYYKKRAAADMNLSSIEAVNLGRLDGEKFNIGIKDKLDTTSNGFLLQAER